MEVSASIWHNSWAPEKIKEGEETREERDDAFISHEFGASSSFHFLSLLCVSLSLYLSPPALHSREKIPFASALLSRESHYELQARVACAPQRCRQLYVFRWTLSLSLLVP